MPTTTTTTTTSTDRLRYPATLQPCCCNLGTDGAFHARPPDRTNQCRYAVTIQVIRIFTSTSIIDDDGQIR